MKISAHTILVSLMIAAFLSGGAAPVQGKKVRQTAADGGCYAEMDCGGDPFHPAIGSFALRDSDGRLLWARPQFGQSACWIATGGQTVVGFNGSGEDGSAGSLTFYGPNGGILKTLSVDDFTGGEYTAAGNLFICRTGELGLAVFDCTGQLQWRVPTGSQYYFDRYGSRLAVVSQGSLVVYHQGRLQGGIPLSTPYVRDVRFDPAGLVLEVSAGTTDMTIDLSNLRLLARTERSPAHPTVQGSKPNYTKAGTANWPFDPIDAVHPLGNGWGEYQNYGGDPYFHPGIDVMAMDTSGVPVYAVAHGWIKAWLSTGGTYYWRFAIADTSSDYADSCDGWLYAHMDASRPHAAVGDEVWPGDQIGYLVKWPVVGFDHCHFARIRDAGSLWGNNGADWVFQDHPLNLLLPGDDGEPPVIEQALTGSLFAFCRDNTGDYLSPGNLSGDIDIVARCYDRFGQAIQIFPEWEKLNPFKLEYAIHGPGGSVPRTTAFMFAHFLAWNDGGLVNTVFKQDDSCHTYGDYDYRQYYYIVTNTDGDSILEATDTNGCWRSTDISNGQYWVVVYASDQYGNTTADSQLVTVNNPTGVEGSPGSSVFTRASLRAFPSPTKGPISIQYTIPVPMPVTLRVFNLCGQVVRTLEQGVHSAGGYSTFWDGNIMGGSKAPNGVYVVQLDCPVDRIRGKVVVIR